MPIRRVVALSLILSLCCLPVLGQNGNADLLARIRKEAMERSQIMKTMHMFTDVYGPRLTGSPNHKSAADWAVSQMTSWGLE
ncbi:MAG: peptidase M28, partial [Acidobacteria bacterium]